MSLSRAPFSSSGDAARRPPSAASGETKPAMRLTGETGPISSACALRGAENAITCSRARATRGLVPEEYGSEAQAVVRSMNLCRGAKDGRAATGTCATQGRAALGGRSSARPLPTIVHGGWTPPASALRTCNA
ncbi:hypothetical protein Efla_001339 [Eimeria flavescens]